MSATGASAVNSRPDESTSVALTAANLQIPDPVTRLVVIEDRDERRVARLTRVAATMLGLSRIAYSLGAET